MEQLLKNIWFDSFYRNVLRGGFFHTELEHCSEDGTSGRQDSDMATDLLVFFCRVETECNIAVQLVGVQTSDLTLSVKFANTCG